MDSIKYQGFRLAGLCVLFVFPIRAQQTPALAIAPEPVSKGFIENKGQVVDQNYKPNKAIKYLLGTTGFNVQLKQTGFSYDTYRDSIDAAEITDPLIKDNPRFPKNRIRIWHRVDVDLLECNRKAELIPSVKSEAYLNYLTAGTPPGGVNFVHWYSKVLYKNIYNNIDLEFSSDRRNALGMEYQFIIHPGGKLSDIKLAYRGQNELTLQNNELLIRVESGSFKETIPSSFLKESGQKVNVSYLALGKNRFSFSLDHAIPLTEDLVVDPTPCLLWGSYIQEMPQSTSSTNEFAASVAVGPDTLGIAAGASGHNYDVFVTGTTFSSGMTTAGVYQTSLSGTSDAFVSRFLNTGKLRWETYLGGSGNENGFGIATGQSTAPTFNGTERIYVTGSTTSTNLNIPGAGGGLCQASSGGGMDAFIADLLSNGTVPGANNGANGWVTYFGGTQTDFGTAIFADENDFVYVTGQTNSTAGTGIGGDGFGMYNGLLISTPNAQLSFQAGSNPIFVASLNSNGRCPLDSWTYFSGNNNTGATVINTVNSIWYNQSSSGLYICGTTNCFCTFSCGESTLNNYDETLTGNGGIFVSGGNATNIFTNTVMTEAGFYAKFLVSNTCCGGDILITNGVSRTTGGVSTTILPTEAGYFDGGESHGGPFSTVCTGICTGVADHYFMTGFSNDPNLAVFYGAKFQASNAGGFDAFVYNDHQNEMTWYGGPGNDFATGIAVLQNGTSFNGTTFSTVASPDMYITGYTNSTTGISTAGAYETSTNSGKVNAFLADFNNSLITLNFATYYGGAGNTRSTGIALDPLGFMYIAGSTTSAPATIAGGLENGNPPVHQITFSETGSDSAAFVAKFGCYQVSALPIELIYFNAFPNKDHIQVDLFWSTATETNNNYFTIERSSDGQSFENVSAVKGAGTSTKRLDYASLDPEPLKGLSYYRLKQTDYDGKFAYSPLVAVNFETRANSFNLFPNPVSKSSDGSVSMNLTGLQKNTSVLLILTDILGREYCSKVLMSDNNGLINLTVDNGLSLSPGVYLVIASSENKLLNKKVVVK